MGNLRRIRESLTTDEPIQNSFATEDITEPRRIVTNTTTPDSVVRDDSETADDDDDDVEHPAPLRPEHHNDDIENPAPLRRELHREAAIEASDASNLRDWESTSAKTADQYPDEATANTPLFSEFDVSDLRSRWSNVQAGFVDSPRRAVEQADELVLSVIQKLANGFAEERSSLESQWDRSGTVSTEDLRVALQRYRAFFGRLLNAA